MRADTLRTGKQFFTSMKANYITIYLVLATMIAINSIQLLVSTRDFLSVEK